MLHLIIGYGVSFLLRDILVEIVDMDNYIVRRV